MADAKHVAFEPSAEHPLAQGFNLSQGAVNVIVPGLVPSNDYFVVCEC